MQPVQHSSRDPDGFMRMTNSGLQLSLTSELSGKRTDKWDKALHAG